MDLQNYIESGVIESYLLGLASEEETALLEQMRSLYPQLNTEIAAIEKKLQRVVAEEGVTPPSVVWNRLSRRLNWEDANRQQQAYSSQGQKEDMTYVLRPQSRTMVVSVWWRCAFIALCVIVMALLASTIYFYGQFRRMEERMMHLYTPAAQPSKPVQQ